MDTATQTFSKSFRKQNCESFKPNTLSSGNRKTLWVKGGREMMPKGQESIPILNAIEIKDSILSHLH